MVNGIGNLTGQWGQSASTGATGYTAADVAAGLIPGNLSGYRTPDMDWQDLMRNVGRTWSSRVPLQDLRSQLETRYQLAQTPGQTFSGFLGSRIPGSGGGYLTQQALRDRAEEAARFGGMSIDEYGDYQTSVGGPESQLGLESASLRDYFEPASQTGRANQMGAANLLALQRGGGGGQYQGRMAGAIQDAIQAMAASRFGQGHDPGSFLNWYLSQGQ